MKKLMLLIFLFSFCFGGFADVIEDTENSLKIEKAVSYTFIIDVLYSVSGDSVGEIFPGRYRDYYYFSFEKKSNSVLEIYLKSDEYSRKEVEYVILFEGQRVRACRVELESRIFFAEQVFSEEVDVEKVFTLLKDEVEKHLP